MTYKDVELFQEQQGIYDVVTGEQNSTEIKVNDLTYLLHQGVRGKGAKK